MMIVTNFGKTCTDSKVDFTIQWSIYFMMIVTNFGRTCLDSKVDFII